VERADIAVHGQVELHMAAGMAVTIIESPRLLQSVQGIPATHMYVCEVQGIPRIGNCAGMTGEAWDSMQCRIYPEPENEFG
jgi:hypothetical protein